MSGSNMDGFFDLQPPNMDQSGNPMQPNQTPQSVSYFYIAAKECRLVLDIEGGRVAPGSKVILWEQKEPLEADNQLWYNDSQTGTIRSKADPSLVLDLIDNFVHVNIYQQGNTSQLWEGSDQFIRNRMTPTQVFQVTGTDLGCEITSAQSNFSSPQIFEPVFLNTPLPPSNPTPSNPQPTPPYPQPTPPYPQPTPPNPSPFNRPTDCPENNISRHFFVVSQMHGKVLDIRGGNAEEGAEVIAYHKQSDAPLNQLWYWGQEGLLHSALNHYVPTAEGLATQLRMYKYTGGVSQRFKMDGNKITNGAGECVDVRGGSKWDNTDIITYNYKGDSNQHWTLEFV